MQNEEKLLTVEDAYDAVVDYLKKFYRQTKSDDIGALAGEMNLLSDGSSVDPAAQEDWNDSVSKILNKNADDRKKFELSGNRLNITQAYEAMIDFLDGYRYRTTSSETALMLLDMKLVGPEKSLNPIVWNDWIESVDKILKQNPRVRPLLFFRNAKVLTSDDAYETMFNYLNEYYNRTNATDIKILLENMKRSPNTESKDPAEWNEWVQDVEIMLNQNSESIENGLTAKQAYESMIIFLEKYHQKTNSNEVMIMLNDMKFTSSNISTDPNAWYLWLESVNKTLNKYRTF